MSGEQPELPLVAYPLSVSGSFSERTLHLLLICLPTLVHTVEIQATSSVCKPGNRDHQSPLYWYGALLIGQQRHLPVGPTTEGCVGVLRQYHSFHLSSPCMSSLKEHFL